MHLLATLLRPGVPVMFAYFTVELGPDRDVALCSTKYCYLLGCMTLCAMLLLLYSSLIGNESCDNA